MKNLAVLGLKFLTAAFLTTPPCPRPAPAFAEATSRPFAFGQLTVYYRAAGIVPPDLGLQLSRNAVKMVAGSE